MIEPGLCDEVGTAYSSHDPNVISTWNEKDEWCFFFKDGEYCCSILPIPRPNFDRLLLEVVFGD